METIRRLLLQSQRKQSLRLLTGGTYLCIEFHLGSSFTSGIGYQCVIS